MSQTDESQSSDADSTEKASETVHREYLLDVRIVAVRDGDAETRYRFEAPHHVGAVFEDPELAELYADVYFDVNGFDEAGTGDRGVPPEIIQAGRDTLAAYFLTRPGIDTDWVASFFGVKRERIETYVEWVRQRGTEIRAGARDAGLE
ncbi:hypothetical protein C499_07715 [Halogeometricum borinquense DSM 11551]|uniref:Uncharacterized protein n=2 Tax=Halogeometricum borinquense TaxID=60847 RepID=E4NMB2_HALBP|nr:hypothetical protein [Halogeometricum borinquense]ADQ67317.1 hypothetical protein Hbor_17490 [Halogeometricum borinquense DSM 11551]ELY28532.1 hypothetical protein C499_07715 [Halogeometricum borinquense DSM 11551]RYJ13671.1 hypothetical protein ELS19_06645 [Halogeometricum borinquense]